MTGENHRESYAAHGDEDELTLDETEAIDAAVSGIAYEIWQQDGRDQNLDRMVEKMNLEYAEQHRQKPLEEQPGWAQSVTNILGSKKNG